MKTNKFDEIYLDESDIMDQLMMGRDLWNVANVTVDPAVDIEKLVTLIQDPGKLMTWTFPEASDIAVPEFDHIRQSHWFMPEQYRNMDIAEYVLSLCVNEEQLQRCGQELLMFQERGLFDLLRYMKYLVDIMRTNHVIWGVGRGSSVASYVLFKLGVHRIDSLFYDLDPMEFLR